MSALLVFGTLPAGNASPVNPEDRYADSTIRGDRRSVLVASLLKRLGVDQEPTEGSELRVVKSGARPALTEMPSLDPANITQGADGKLSAVNQNGDKVIFTLDPILQNFARETLNSIRAPHAAIVVMNPASGKILAVADRSSSISDLSLHSGFPTASLFKVITAAAAVEKSRMSPYTPIHYRGGLYTLNQSNYLPNPRRDRNSLTASEALGKSCNPVFGRIALEYTTPETLAAMCRNFGFNSSLGFDVPLVQSRAEIPYDTLEFSRTGAGFGAVYISPLHAAAIAAGLGNHGRMPRPYLIDSMVNQKGEVVYQAEPAIINHMVSPETAKTLLNMMEYTTTMGTSKGAFMRGGKSLLGSIRVAAKTGTLKGQNPEGITNWFIATAPIENPQIALATVVMDPGGVSSKASYLGRLMFQKYFGFNITPPSSSKKGSSKHKGARSFTSAKKPVSRTYKAAGKHKTTVAKKPVQSSKSKKVKKRST